MRFKDFFLKEAKLKPNELKVGDKVENVNPDCDHYKSKGVVTKIHRLPKKTTKKVKNGKNTPGCLAVYKVTNDGKNYKQGDELEKTEIQLSKQ